MRTAIRCTVVVAAVAWAAAAQAQTRSRVDLEFGGGSLAGRPGLVIGATSWVGDHSGVAVRSIFIPESDFERTYWGSGLEAQYRHRESVRGDFEIDFGVGLMFWRPPGWADFSTFETVEVLVRRRLLERLDVKAGFGVVSTIFSDETGLIGTLKAMAVVPLGRRRQAGIRRTEEPCNPR